MTKKTWYDDSPQNKQAEHIILRMVKDIFIQYICHKSDRRKKQRQQLMSWQIKKLAHARTVLT